jgi:hypothetical protein
MVKLSNVNRLILKIYLLIFGYFVLIWLLTSINSYSKSRAEGVEMDFLLGLVMHLFSPYLVIFLIGAVFATIIHLIIAKIFMYTPRS